MTKTLKFLAIMLWVCIGVALWELLTVLIKSVLNKCRVDVDVTIDDMAVIPGVGEFEKSSDTSVTNGRVVDAPEP